MTETLKVVRTCEQLQELLDYLKDKDLVSIDTETTGVDKESQVIGISVCAEVEIGWYVVLHEWSVELQCLLPVLDQSLLPPLLARLSSVQTIMHNAPFDVWMIDNNFQVNLMHSVVVDTMILAHLVDENRSNGLKELGISLFGDNAGKEQQEMKASVSKNGGVLTKEKYELYKADSELIARYGAKDAILTLKVFYSEMPKLLDQGLEDFFFTESMPLLKGATYDLNTVGLCVDPERLSTLRRTLEAECLEMKAFIYKEIEPAIHEEYPGTSKAKTFNINAPKQRSWLLFIKLNNEFSNLTDEGREVCKALGLKLPYTPSAKREFMRLCTAAKGTVYCPAKVNIFTGKAGRPKKVGSVWNYLACGKESLAKLAEKYRWVETYLKYAKNTKLLTTYVEGIQARMKYNVIRPQFLQNVVPSGRYASRNPNFMNLPRDDKRVKQCIIPRSNKVFVGADEAQVEARVFASLSGDWRLQESFARGEDFYSVVGMTTFSKSDCTPFKEGSPDAFGVKYRALRQVAKVIALAATYGAEAPRIAALLGISIQQAQEILDNYFESFPSVRQFMLDSHKEAISQGFVKTMFGRVRRLPEALDIGTKYRGIPKNKLPAKLKNLLNLSVNFKVQGATGSIMNLSTIAFRNALIERDIPAKIILQVHDSLVAETDREHAEIVAELMQHAMEHTVQLPGVALVAEPKIGYDLSEV